LESSILLFFVAVAVLIMLLKSRREPAIARAMLSWIGPRPVVAEALARYQLRWAMYSFGWLCQIAVLFGLLWATGKRFPGVPDQSWFLLFAFALTLGGGIAVLATLGFLCKTIKARLVGPNPVYVAPLPEAGKG
jgi:hypothetical protein